MRTIIAAITGLVLAAAGTWALTSGYGPVVQVAGGVLVSVGGCLMALTWLRLRWLAAVPFEPVASPSTRSFDEDIVPMSSRRAAAG
jgi:hypothetical protein